MKKLILILSVLCFIIGCGNETSHTIHMKGGDRVVSSVDNPQSDNDTARQLKQIPEIAINVVNIGKNTYVYDLPYNGVIYTILVQFSETTYGYWTQSKIILKEVKQEK